MDNGENDTRRGAGASNIIPFRRPAASIVKPYRLPPKPVLWLDEVQLVRPPPKVRQALAAVPKVKSVPYTRLFRHRLRLPYGRWVTKDKTTVLFNRRYEPIFIWRAGADRPERCDPHWIHEIVKEGWFFSDGSTHVIGRAALWHALEAMLAAWERGDRAAAAALERWLLSRHAKFRYYHTEVSEPVTPRINPRV
jgi:hypothetical protein